MCIRSKMSVLLIATQFIIVYFIMYLYRYYTNIVRHFSMACVKIFFFFAIVVSAIDWCCIQCTRKMDAIISLVLYRWIIFTNLLQGYTTAFTLDYHTRVHRHSEHVIAGLIETSAYYRASRARHCLEIIPYRVGHNNIIVYYNLQKNNGAGAMCTAVVVANILCAAAGHATGCYRWNRSSKNFIRCDQL